MRKHLLYACKGYIIGRKVDSIDANTNLTNTWKSHSAVAGLFSSRVLDYYRSIAVKQRQGERRGFLIFSLASIDITHLFVDRD